MGTSKKSFFTANGSNLGRPPIPGPLLYAKGAALGGKLRKGRRG